ncbi:acylphosphatase [Floccifex sp.]|uniref:acylphosphatase n=1 Tax=Floccifex sp. TaxID=2815810 RepID=UPI003F0CBA7F
MFLFKKKPKINKPITENTIRYEYHFYGQVQGVGFRFMATQYAQQLQLTGWVKNCDDGSVLMEVQGEKHDIDHLIDLLQNDKYIHISQITSKTKQTIEEDDFYPRY